MAQNRLLSPDRLLTGYIPGAGPLNAVADLVRKPRSQNPNLALHICHMSRGTRHICMSHLMSYLHAPFCDHYISLRIGLKSKFSHKSLFAEARLSEPI
ncbi:hypothetical protein AX14_006539 [Amanita brunnescens Koide BX004]|nr:hypothetical protein AX14_006539 [Amanita brunnescens Koide BX004]